MKKFITFIILIVVLGAGGMYVYNNVDFRNEDKIKEGWHVEVITEYLNVRKETDANSSSLGKIYKGEIYKVLDYKKVGSNHWYKIRVSNKIKGWVASGRNFTYLKDNNNPEDVATPTLKFQENEVHAFDYSDIDYSHLEIWDDKDNYKVTYKVYYEAEKDQYWILWHVEDAAGKSAEKMQKIVFEIKPSSSEVLDFKDYKKK